MLMRIRILATPNRKIEIKLNTRMKSQKEDGTIGNPTPKQQNIKEMSTVGNSYTKRSQRSQLTCRKSSTRRNPNTPTRRYLHCHSLKEKISQTWMPKENLMHTTSKEKYNRLQNRKQRIEKISHFRISNSNFISCTHQKQQKISLKEIILEKKRLLEE